MTDKIKIPVNVKKMEIAMKEMETIFQLQKTTFQQSEKIFYQFQKYANTFIENSKKQLEKKPRKLSGFALPVPISSTLCNFLNIPEGSQVSRTEVTRFLIQYIQENNLVDPEKKTIIIPNETLKNLLGPDVDLHTLTRFTIQKYMNQHYCRVGEPMVTMPR
jgi:chromatin remodeling complex protein RSC6